MEGSAESFPITKIKSKKCDKMAHILCTQKTFEGVGVLPNTIMATLRGGGGIKVLKMYYVVCD